MKLLVDVLKLELGKLKFIILFCKELYFLVDILDLKVRRLDSIEWVFEIVDLEKF